MRFSKLNMNRLLGFSHLNKAGSWLFITVLLAGDTWDQHSSIMILGKFTGSSHAWSIYICNVKLWSHFFMWHNVRGQRSTNTAWLCGAQPPSSWFVKVSSRWRGGGSWPCTRFEKKCEYRKATVSAFSSQSVTCAPPPTTLLPLASFQERSVKKHDILQGSLQLWRREGGGAVPPSRADWRHLRRLRCTTFLLLILSLTLL